MLLDTWDWILIAMGVGLLGYLGFMVFGGFRFKHRFVVRQVIRDKLYITYDKAKVVEVDGVKYWKLKKMKDLLPVPPPEAIDVMKWGRLFVEAYRNENGEYCYIKDTADGANFFQPLTTNQRLIWINQIKKAAKKRGFAWTDHAPLIASGMILIIVMGIMFGFWEDITKPSIQALEINLEKEKVELEQLKILQEINYNVQRIGDEQSRVRAGEQPPN